MVYYLGKDVKVYITTESDDAQVNVASNAVSAISAGGSEAAATAAMACVDGDLNTENKKDSTLVDFLKYRSEDIKKNNSKIYWNNCLRPRTKRPNKNYRNRNK